MPGPGLEPGWDCSQGILSPSRLPISPPRRRPSAHPKRERGSGARRSLFAVPQSGKRDSNPRPQPWQGCALPTELFPRTRVQSNRRTPVRTRRLGACASRRLALNGGEGDRTPDLVNAIHALSQLSYAPRILGPGKTRFGGNTASYRDVMALSSDVMPWHELFVL